MDGHDRDMPDGEHSRIVRDLRYKATYGLPWDLEEQRWAIEQISGPLPPAHKRCDRCHGEGVVDVVELQESSEQVCPICGGHGVEPIRAKRSCSFCEGKGSTKHYYKDLAVETQTTCPVCGGCGRA